MDGRFHIQWNGEGKFVQVTARLEGSTLSLMTQQKDKGAEEGVRKHACIQMYAHVTYTASTSLTVKGATPIVHLCQVTTVDLSKSERMPLKNPRKKYPHAFRINLGIEDNRGRTRYTTFILTCIP